MNNEVSNLYSICAFLHSVQVAVDTKGSNPDWTKPKPVPDWAATLQFWKQPFLWYQCSLFLIELYFYFFDKTDADLVVAAVAGDDGPGHGHVGVVVIVLRLDEVVPHLHQ